MWILSNRHFYNEGHNCENPAALFIIQIVALYIIEIKKNYSVTYHPSLFCNEYKKYYVCHAF